MSRFQLPKYFVPHADSQNADHLLADREETPLHVIDSFFIGNRHLKEREWIVTVDAAGALQAWQADENRHLFPSLLQNELAFNEVSRGGAARSLEASEVFLFNLQLVEQPSGVPGWNDPVYLYGTLFGSVPDWTRGGGVDNRTGVKGQLTVTRGDLLDGAVQSADFAFRYGGMSTIGGGFSRCFHLMLPGSSAEEIRRGAGLILAYPLFPAELIATDIANETVLSQMLYDLLSTLKEDLERERVVHPLRAIILPVASRFLLEQKLESEGYTIEGHTAVKRSASNSGFKGVLASVFGSLMTSSLTLPPEGSVDDFLALTRDTLRNLPNDFPAPQIIALRNCLKLVEANRQTPYSPVDVDDASAALISVTTIKTPLQSSAPPLLSPLTTAAADLHRRSSDSSSDVQRSAPADNEPPAWMRDFIDAHHKTNEAPPKLTSTSKNVSPIISSANDKSAKLGKVEEPPRSRDWMKDFEPPPPPVKEKQAGETKAKGSEIKADWMKDFESHD